MSFNANDPNLKSWVDVKPGSDFPIQNLPFGIFKYKDLPPRVGSAIGDQVIDLVVLFEHAFFDDFNFDKAVLEKDNLNEFISLGKKTTSGVRNRLAEILDTNLDEWDASQLSEFFLYPMSEVEMLMPVKVGDYTDFYSSIEHATNVGTMFRGKDNALMPNWKHLPVGYHGRSSSIVASGTPIKRPKGQMKPADADAPVYGPTKLLDFELEMGFVVGRETQMGDTISVEQADDYIFGMVLFNDWSARDIQGWEYVPLGPFLGKNFGSTVSPWIVTMEALEPFRVEGPKQDPAVLPYLEFKGKRNYDIHLQVIIAPESGEEKVVCSSNHKYLYWNMAQQLAHHTVNGCNMRIGDICASGTISGPDESSFGSMLELTWRGAKPLTMPDGSERKFIHDGDTVKLKGWCEKDGVRIGFGDCSGKVLQAD
jgi:fumarylacetoacetase